MRCSPSIVLVV